MITSVFLPKINLCKINLPKINLSANIYHPQKQITPIKSLLQHHKIVAIPNTAPPLYCYTAILLYCYKKYNIPPKKRPLRDVFCLVFVMVYQSRLGLNHRNALLDINQAIIIVGTVGVVPLNHFGISCRTKLTQTLITIGT